ncbi:MAG: hypothetical protein WKG06_29140 [Segetibacter sp.]
MLLRIETEVFGNFIIKDEIEVLLQPYKIQMRYEATTGLHMISLTKKVVNYESYIPKAEVTNNQISKIEFPDNGFFEEQINILRHIESFGAIDFEISSINWQNCTIEWINEPGEEVIIPIRKYSRKPNYENGKPKVLTPNWLQNTVIFRNQLSDLTLPFSFFREGANLFNSMQYQNAFINFYLMLEGFFGNSQFKNEKIKEEFTKSEILKYGIESTLDTLLKQNNKHVIWVTQTLNTYNKNLDSRGIIHLLVEYRGKLSHFSLGKTNMKNPFNDKGYESLAYLTMAICIFSSVKLRLEPFRKK